MFIIHVIVIARITIVIVTCLLLLLHLLVTTLSLGLSNSVMLVIFVISQVLWCRYHLIYTNTYSITFLCNFWHFLSLSKLVRKPICKFLYYHEYLGLMLSVPIPLLNWLPVHCMVHNNFSPWLVSSDTWQIVGSHHQLIAWERFLFLQIYQEAQAK